MIKAKSLKLRPVRKIVPVTSNQLRADLEAWKQRIEKLNKEYGADSDEVRYARWAAGWIRNLAKKMYPQGPEPRLKVVDECRSC